MIAASFFLFVNEKYLSMKNILKRLKLYDNQTTTLPISRLEFVNRLNELVEEGSTSMVSDSFDAFDRSNKEFKGSIFEDSFKIKKRHKLFDFNLNSAVAFGTFVEKDNQLIIETKIRGVNAFFMIFYLLLLVVFPISMVSILRSESQDVQTSIILVLLQFVFMFGIPYLLLRMSTQRLKRDLEKQFFCFFLRDL